MKNKIPVTVGIPTYNEESNIAKPSKIRVAIDTLLSLQVSQENSKVYGTIGTYRLYKRITKENGFNHNFVGIYKKGGKKYFIKTWSGKMQNHYYQAIVRELLINEDLCNLMLESRIRTPKIIEYFSTKNSLSLVYEYIEGKLLSAHSVKKQAQVWLYVNEFFKKICLDSNNEKYLINLEKKDKIYYLVTISYVTLLSLVSSFKHYKLIFKAYVKALIEFFKVKNERLVINHCDLSPDNIIVSKDKVYILDCGRLSLTLPEYDITYISIKPAFRKLYKSICKETDILGNNFLGLYLSIQNIKLLDQKNEKFDHFKNL